MPVLGSPVFPAIPCNVHWWLLFFYCTCALDRRIGVCPLSGSKHGVSPGTLYALRLSVMHALPVLHGCDMQCRLGAWLPCCMQELHCSMYYQGAGCCMSCWLGCCIALFISVRRLPFFHFAYVLCHSTVPVAQGLGGSLKGFPWLWLAVMQPWAPQLSEFCNASPLAPSALATLVSVTLLKCRDGSSALANRSPVRCTVQGY